MAPVASPPLLEKSAPARIPRRCARQRVTTLMYADLGPGNGGFPINISEDGMAFQGIRPLVKDQQLHITLKLDGLAEKVSAKARVVWLTENGKGGGLQFLELAEASRQLIRDWIALQNQAGDARQARPPIIPQMKAKSTRSRPAVPEPSRRSSSVVDPEPATSSKAQARKSSGAGHPAPPPARPIIRAVVPDAPVRENPVAENGAHGKSADGLLGLRPAPPLPVPANNVKPRPAFSLKGPGLVLVIAGVGLLVFGAARHSLHGVALPQFLRNLTLRSALQTAPRKAVARVSQPAPSVEPSRDFALVELLPLAPVRTAQENLVTLLVLQASTTAPSGLKEKPSKPALKSAPAPAPKPVIAAGQIQRTPRPVPPVHSELPSAAPPAMPNQLNAASTLRSAAAAPEPPASPTAETPAKLPDNAAKVAGTVEIIPDLYPSIRVPAGSKGQAPRPGTSLRIGRLYSKIEPAYPQEALRQRLAGTVKVHVMIGTNGTVERAELLEGPALLGETVLRDVRQWLYEPTMVGTQPIGVEEDISFVFRITNSAPAAN